ncbi:MAG: TonB family protein [Candidatus Saccharibacteria bacterium]|nr:TonB family protein [Rhodoferax sp.]
MQCSPLFLALFLGGGSVAHAQLVVPAGAASAPAEDPMERAKRQANNVMRWIKVHADKPRATTAKEAAAPAPAPAPVARPAPRTATAPGGYAPAPEPEKSVVTAAPTPEPTTQAPPPVAAPVAPPPSAAAALAIAKTSPLPIVEEEDTPLKALSQPQPVIPRNLLSTIDTGKVMVRFMVETNGSVSNVEVLNSSSRLLNKPTVAAISTWRFEPIKAPRPAQIEIVFNP